MSEKAEALKWLNALVPLKANCGVLLFSVNKRKEARTICSNPRSLLSEPEFAKFVYAPAIVTEPHEPGIADSRELQSFEFFGEENGHQTPISRPMSPSGPKTGKPAELQPQTENHVAASKKVSVATCRSISDVYWPRNMSWHRKQEQQRPTTNNVESQISEQPQETLNPQLAAQEKRLREDFEKKLLDVEKRLRDVFEKELAAREQRLQEHFQKQLADHDYKHKKEISALQSTMNSSFAEMIEKQVCLCQLRESEKHHSQFSIIMSL